MNEVVIAGAARTPIGTFGGAFAEVPATRLGAVAIAEALKRAGVKPEQVDEVLMGNVLSAGLGMNPARQAALAAGIPDSTPAIAVNKVCGSGLKTVALAAGAIMRGDAEIVVAGGMEGMSSAPYLLPKARYGYRMGHGEVTDHMIKDGLWGSLEDCHMGGNASGINDGGAAVVVMSRQKAEELGVKPLASVRAYASAGVAPRVMGLGPLPATRNVLAKSGLSLAEIDLIEANEAFAAQSLAVGRELGWDWERVNVNGGAIALGHPIGASGARILVTLLYEMKRRQAKRGLATLCIGGGQGISMIVESVN